MSESLFSPGAAVVTNHGDGTIIDVRATVSGAWVFGVEGADGSVSYYTEKALQLSEQ